METQLLLMLLQWWCYFPVTVENLFGAPLYEGHLARTLEANTHTAFWDGDALLHLGWNQV